MTLAYTIDQAATAVGVSRQTIQRAIQATDPRSFPPPLRAKRAGTSSKARYLIPADALADWVNSLPEA